MIKNQEFLQLSTEQLAALLASDELKVASERHVFEALISWVQFEAANRRQQVARLLSFVKLPLLEPAYLADHVEGAVGADLACQRLILEAMKWHLLPERRQQMMSARTRPRKSTLGKLLVVGGTDKHKGSATIESYDPRDDAWTVAYTMNGGKRLQFGIALMGEK